VFENAGILLALVALVGWAFGDFFIQKSARLIGWYKTTFVIGAMGLIGFFPLVAHEVLWYGPEILYPLLGISFLTLIYAWTDFEALRIGKLSVVEAVVAIELPLAVLLAVMIGKEELTLNHTVLFVFTTLGIMLASIKRLEFVHFSRYFLERGVWLALVASCFSALTYYYVGAYAQSVSPLFVIWFTHGALAVVCGLYISVRGEWRDFWKGVRASPGQVAAVGILDNTAWASYAVATSIIPISVAVTVSEGYIALAALLGYLLNGEKLKRHQILGAVLAFLCVGILSATL
jgi:drug/metabolite transporter (DMT)-like permease